MRRGISYVGSNTRLRKVVWDMMQVCMGGGGGGGGVNHAWSAGSTTNLSAWLQLPAI
jgi:hypothetical protein